MTNKTNASVIGVAAPSTTSTGVMSAARLRLPNEIELVECDIPAPGPNQLLVRLEGCGVCASNMAPWEGRPWFNYPMAPGELGHEGWGTVVEVGNNVTNFAAGDRVATISYRSYAQFDLANADAAVRLPPELDDQPFPGEPLACALNIFRRSEIKPKDTVAIVGVGFLGALLTQLSAAAGARVIAISRADFPLQMAREMGASTTLKLQDAAQITTNVEQLTEGKFCDVVIEATGKQAPLDLAAELTRTRGRLVIAGYHQDGLRQINLQLWNWRGLDVINAHERDPRIYLQGMEQAVRAVASGFLNPAPLFTHRFPLAELSRALEMTAQRPNGFMKALVTME
jgi:2-desacetyl-2-hydroxyethyl bacteriochlorophyllide A dehydrogenase